MKKIIVIASLLALNTVAATPLDEQERLQGLVELGLPLPGSGIKLIPRAMFGLSEEQIQRGEKAAIEMEILGYAVEESTRPMELLHFQNTAKNQFITYANNNQQTSTHLRRKPKDLKLAFNFKGIPQQRNLAGNDLVPIAVSPQGAFDDEKGGWTGAAQYFSVKSIGVCSYAVMNVGASETAAELAVEDVTYTINNKATLTSVRGKPGFGFIYKLEWFDDLNFHELECANMKYSINITNDVVQLAKLIDIS
jgi:hypothetical protein